MSNPKVLIVEDDLIIASHIASVIENAGFEVIEILTKGESVPSFLANSTPDVILMDIQLAGEQDGIETAKIVLDTYATPVIFLTANADRVSFEKSKEAYPQAFIAKPFKEDDLLRALELVFNKKGFKSNHKNEPSDNFSLEDRIFVRDKKKMIRLKFEDILYAEADRNYCIITTKEKNYTLSVPLSKFEAKVGSTMFLRIHRSFLVNISAIDQLDEHYVFVDGKSLPVSKTYKPILSKRLTVI